MTVALRHGHVRPRPDGLRPAPCGGPEHCDTCRSEAMEQERREDWTAVAVAWAIDPVNPEFPPRTVCRELVARRLGEDAAQAWDALFAAHLRFRGLADLR